MVVPPGDDWFTQPAVDFPRDGDGTSVPVLAVSRPGEPPTSRAPSGGVPGPAAGRVNGAPLGGAGFDGGRLGGASLEGARAGGARMDGGRMDGRRMNGAPDGAASDDAAPLDGGRANGAAARAPGEGRHQWSADSSADPVGEPRDDGFDPGDTGTWRVRDVVPGGEGGRRTTTILRYLLGLLAVDNVRKLTRFAFVVPVLGALLLLVRPRWIGAAVLVLGVLLVVGRIAAVRLIGRRSLARRYRPVEDDLRAAVEAGKANLRGELRRAGLPSSSWAIPLSVVRLGPSTARSQARSRLLEIEIDRVLPRAQLDRALKVLDEAAPGR